MLNHQSDRSNAMTTPETRDYLVGSYVLAVTILLGLPALYSLHAALPPNTVTLPIEQAVNARVWAPQAWKFFTRNPREPRLLLYAQGTDFTWRLASLAPLAQRQYMFGWGRRSRAQGVEAGLLEHEVSPKDWSDCKVQPAVCLNHLEIKAKVTNISPRPSLCGQIGLIRQEPVPWAWAAARATVSMPSKAVRLEVAC